MTLGPGNIVGQDGGWIGWNVRTGSAEHKGSGRRYTYVRSRTPFWIRIKSNIQSNSNNFQLIVKDSGPIHAFSSPHSWNPTKLMEKLFLQGKTQRYKDGRGKIVDKIWKLETKPSALQKSKFQVGRGKSQGTPQFMLQNTFSPLKWIIDIKDLWKWEMKAGFEKRWLLKDC